MPYAADNVISKAPIEGGIQITDQQYIDAREHTKTGIVKVVDGAMYLASRRPQDAPGTRVELDTDAGDWSVIELPRPGDDYVWDADALEWRTDDTMEES